jgi:hypothetical protein
MCDPNEIRRGNLHRVTDKCSEEITNPFSKERRDYE